MAAALGRALSTGLAATYRVMPATNTIINRCPGLLSSVRLMSGRTAAKNTPVEAEPVLDDDMEGEDWMESKSAAVQRRVRALQDVQQTYDTINKDYQKELAQLQAKYLDSYKPSFDLRRDVILGKAPVDKFDIEDDDEKDNGIEEFWLTAFYNHEKIGPYITERDAEVLKHLVDIRASVLTGEERGFELQFIFSDNKYFTNKELTKRYILEPEDDIIPKEFIGCEIKWKTPEVNTTVEMKKKRVKSKDAGKGGKPAFVTEAEPCESFFNIFEPPKIPQNPEELEPTDLDALQEELTADFDIGFAIKDQVIPRAVEWYTGELSQFDDEFEDEFEGEDFEEDEPAPPPSPRGRR